MTNREFYNEVIKAGINEDITNFAKEAIAKMDKRNAARVSKPTKSQLANEGIKTLIVDYVTENGECEASVIAKAISTEDAVYSTNKVVALCGQLVYNNTFKVEKKTVKSRGKRNFYSLAE